MHEFSITFLSEKVKKSKKRTGVISQNVSFQKRLPTPHRCTGFANPTEILFYPEHIRKYRTYPKIIVFAIFVFLGYFRNTNNLCNQRNLRLIKRINKGGKFFCTPLLLLCKLSLCQITCESLSYRFQSRYPCSLCLRADQRG